MIKQSIKMSMALVLLLGVNACGGGSSDDSERSATGYVIDSPVEGLSYACGDRTGVTDAQGGFFCDQAPVTFKIGEMKIGELNTFTSDSKVFPQDLLGIDRSNFSDESLLKLIRLLQSLDDDGDISERITLTPEVTSKYSADQNFEQTVLEVLMAPFYENSLVSVEDAIRHLQDSMGSAGYGSVTQEDTNEATGGVDVDALVGDYTSTEESSEITDDAMGDYTDMGDTTSIVDEYTSTDTDTVASDDVASDMDEESYTDFGDIGQGFYVDAAVEGVEYTCGDQTGITDANGTFTFEKGEDCAFSLGDILLREVDAQSLTDNITIIEDDLETAQFLQSLDQDNNPDNGIEIGSEILDKIIESNLTTLPAGEDELRSLLESFGDVEGFEGALVSLDEVQNHLESTKAELEQLGAIIDAANVTSEEVESSMDQLESQLDTLG